MIKPQHDETVTLCSLLSKQSSVLSQHLTVDRDGSMHTLTHTLFKCCYFSSSHHVPSLHASYLSWLLPWPPGGPSFFNLHIRINFRSFLALIFVPFNYLYWTIPSLVILKWTNSNRSRYHWTVAQLDVKWAFW